MKDWECDVDRHLVRYARQSDLGALLALFEARVDWLVNRHRSDQWSSVGKWRDKIRRNIDIGATRVLCYEGVDNDIAGTVTLSWRGDPTFWGPQVTGETQRALYLAKLATDPRRAGGHLGALLLDWATDFAYRRCLRQVRLDAWKTAPGLHRYYRDQGWTYLGNVEEPGRMSGSLFTRTPREIDLTDRLVRTGHRLGEGPTSDRWFRFRDDYYLASAVPVGLVSDDEMEWQTTELPRILTERRTLNPSPDPPGSNREANREPAVVLR